MDSSFEINFGAGNGADPAYFDKKRETAYVLSKHPRLVSKLLKKWSLREIFLILRAEIRKEGKYSGLTRAKVVEALMKFLSEKLSRDEERIKNPSSRRGSNRRRKANNPFRLVIPTTYASGTCVLADSRGESGLYCNNSACRAVWRREDTFCRRCCCFICHEYDDNRDLNLWLVCSSDTPFTGDGSCGMSCHIECAFQHEESGLGKDNPYAAPDGCFFCVSCGKTNRLLEYWEKQFTMAKEAMRVDEVGHRLLLARNLSKGKKRFPNPSEIADEAERCLEDELGPLTGHLKKISRGIDNRLRSGPKVLNPPCSSALHSSQGSNMQDTMSTPYSVEVESNNDCVSSCKKPEMELNEADADKRLDAPVLVGNRNGERSGNGGGRKRSFEQCMEMMMEIERLGRLEKTFGQEFLKWFSERATAEEKSIVKMLFNSFMDQPEALAEQILEMFSDSVLRKRSAFGDSSSAVPSGVRKKL